jgi:excisionase family DNA binding protein
MSRSEPLVLTVNLSGEQLDQIAERVAERMQPTPAVSPWLSTEQAAEYLAAKPSRIHDLVQLGKLSPRRDGRRLLFARADLDAYLKAGA